MPTDRQLHTESQRSWLPSGWMSSPLPFLSMGETAGRLLAGLGEGIAGRQAALLWRADPDSILQGVLWRRSGEIIESQFPDSLFRQDLAVWRNELPDPFGHLSWKPLSGPTSGAPAAPVYLGAECDEDLQRLPSVWEALLPVILRWSLQFEQVLRDRTLAAMAEYAAGAGHEINNPLGSIIGRTSQLLKTESDGEKRRLLESIGAQAYRIRDMIGDTMLFANPPAGNSQRVLMNETLQNVLSLFGDEIAESQVDLEIGEAEPVFIQVDPDQFHIVISELLRNSLNALRENSPEKVRRLLVRCRGKRADGVPGGELELRDTGPGLTREQQQHCFNPFYSGRQAGRGLGFGLSKCWRIVQQHQGTISLSCDQGQTRVQVWFPAAALLSPNESP